MVKYPIWIQNDALQTRRCCEELRKMPFSPHGENTQLLHTSVIWNVSSLIPNWLWINGLQPCLNPFLYLSSTEKFVLSLNDLVLRFSCCYLQARLSSVDICMTTSDKFFHTSSAFVASSPCNSHMGWLKARILIAKAIGGLVPATWKSKIFDLWTAASVLYSKAHSGWRLRVNVSNMGIWL